MKSASLILFFVALGALIALALAFVLHGVLNADEGFYLAASHLVSQGYRPYHDFGYTQGPLWPYLNLPLLEVFGHSLAGQRLAGLGWTIITVGLGAAWLRRKCSWSTATLFVVLLLGAPLWLAFAVKGKTYALAALAVMVGAQAVQGTWSIWLRWTAFVVAAAVGCGARLPVAGFFVPAFFGMLVLTPSWRGRMLAGLFAASCAAGVLVVTAGGAWDRFVFWTMGFHRDSSFYIPVWTHFVDCFRFAPVLWVFAAMTGYAAIKRLSWREGKPSAACMMKGINFFNLSSRGAKRRGDPSRVLHGLPQSASLPRNDNPAERGGHPADVLAGLPRPAARSRNDRFASRDDKVKACVIVLVSLAVGFVSNLSASTTYAEYIFPFIPALAFISAPVASKLFARTSRVIRFLIIAAAIFAGWNYPPEFSPNVLLHAGQAEAFLRATLPAGSVIAGSMPEIAVAAGGRIPLTMAMGKFGITEDFDASLAEERRMMTPPSLQEVLLDPSTRALVGSTSYNWNFFWSLPSYKVLSPKARDSIRNTIRAHYVLSFMNEEYVIYLRR